MRLAGITVLRSMMGQNTPFSNLPSSHSRTTSVPRVKGHTSVRITSRMDSLRSLIAPWMAAPRATASSGLMSEAGSCLNSLPAKRRTTGLLVAPPTSTTLSMSLRRIWASDRLRFTGLRIRSRSGWHASSYWASPTSISYVSSPTMQRIREVLPPENPILQFSACLWICPAVFASRLSRSMAGNFS